MRDSNNLAWLVTQIIWNFMTICIAWGGIHRCIERVDAVYIPPFPLLVFSLMFIFFLLWHVLFMGFLTYLSDIWAGLLKLVLIDSRFLIFYLIHLYPRWVVWKGVVLAGWNDLRVVAANLFWQYCIDLLVLVLDCVIAEQKTSSLLSSLADIWVV